MELPDRPADEPFALQNAPPKPQEPPLFEPKPKARQIPLLRGLMDCPNQQDLFDDMVAN
jgi:hypothetical protein